MLYNKILYNIIIVGILQYYSETSCGVATAWIQCYTVAVIVSRSVRDDKTHTTTTGRRDEFSVHIFYN